MTGAGKYSRLKAGQRREMARLLWIYRARKRDAQAEGDWSKAQFYNGLIFGLQRGGEL